MSIILFALLTLMFAEEKVFIACEGNFYQSNGSIWTIQDGEAYSYQGNPIGEVVQSLYVNNDELYGVESNIDFLHVSTFEIYNNLLEKKLNVK